MQYIFRTILNNYVASIINCNRWLLQFISNAWHAYENTFMLV